MTNVEKIGFGWKNILKVLEIINNQKIWNYSLLLTYYTKNKSTQKSKISVKKHARKSDNVAKIYIPSFESKMIHELELMWKNKWSYIKKNDKFKASKIFSK